MAKLTEHDVLEIRDLYGSGLFPKAELARLYRVSWTAIDDLICGRRWRHIHAEHIDRLIEEGERQVREEIER